MPIEELERELGIHDSIKLASNENPLGPSPRALAAVARRAAERCTATPTARPSTCGAGSPSGSACRRDELLVGNGSNEIIELVVRTFLRPRDEAVMADQAFVIYRMVVQAVGGDAAHRAAARLHARPRGDRRGRDAAHAARLPRQPEQPDRHDLPARGVGGVPRGAAAASSSSSPTTPTPSTSRIPEYPDTIACAATARVPVVTLRTFSKLYGLAGLRIGYARRAGARSSRRMRARAPAVQRERARAGRRARGARRRRARARGRSR